MSILQQPTAPRGARPPLAILHPPPIPHALAPSTLSASAGTIPSVPADATSRPSMPSLPSLPSGPSAHSASGSTTSIPPSLAAHILGRPPPRTPGPRPPTPLGLPLAMRGLPQPSPSRQTALTLSPTSGARTDSEPEEYVDALTLKEFHRLAQNLGDDSLVTRLTSDDSRHPVLFVHFMHQDSPYFCRIRRPYSRVTAFVREVFGLESPPAVLLSNVDLPERARKKVKLLMYPWRAHYPTLDPSNPLQLPVLARTEEGGRLVRLLNSLGNGQTYAYKPQLRLRDVAELCLSSHSLTPPGLPQSFKQRFFVWHTVFALLDHFGHELFVTYRKSVHPDFVLGLRWDLKQYGSFASFSVGALLLLCTLIAYIPIFVLLGFLFTARGWPGGGILYLLIALPAGLLSPLPDYLLRAWSARVIAHGRRFRSKLTADIRRQFGGHAELRSTAAWSLSGPVGNINMHSPLFPHLAVNDTPTLPREASVPPMELKDFLAELKVRTTLAAARITAVQARQGRGSPFLRSYLLFFINLGGQDMAIRVDPPAKKLTWWHPYEHAVYPSQVRITSVAADDAAEVIENAGSGAQGSHILFTLNSWKTAFIDIDPKEPTQLISLASQSRAAHRRLTSLTDVPGRLTEFPTPTLQDALRSVQAAHDEFHPAYSAALFMLRVTLSVIRAFAIAYSNEYLPSAGDRKIPVHPVIFLNDQYVMQHHRAMIRHLNMLITALFYGMLIALAFVSPSNYSQFLVANTTIIIAAMACWFAWQKTFWPAWLGRTESGIDDMAKWLGRKILPKAVPLPRGSYFPPDRDKPTKPLNWDVPPAGYEAEFEVANAEWAQRVSSRMASSSHTPSSRLPSSVRVPQLRDASLERQMMLDGGMPQMRERSAERR
ncbi:hypothetical protein CALCODRAFT_505961 [Calocera cornea HHB12733]|uniref:Uncharacterized protein n=1 Tax=Calocera cornea HHB12733 TaxID=1353952 RepID=A0A165JIH7_9BASI|nr:hypothetical protein CALCODRAFT_505961 [Calocera cornea HHB12733]